MRDTYDIVISGGGVAGLTAAAAFGSAGFKTLCVDPQAPITVADKAGTDLRTTAFLQPAQQLLERAGLWSKLEPFAAPLHVMRINDISSAPTSRDFNSKDLGDKPFGWNLQNWVLRREMVARLAELKTVRFKTEVSAQTLHTRQKDAFIRLSDGSQVQAKLVIAADGRDSTMRQAAGISTQTIRFGQRALTFAVTHAMPHENVSTEVHLSGGPFTLVPLKDYNGLPCSAVVWMDDASKTRDRETMDEVTFNAEITRRSGGVLGPLTLATRRSSWPIIAQLAKRFYSERLALIAEAAHVVPPIGAQGLNMSLADITWLLNHAIKSPETLGTQDMLESYNKTRWPNVAARVKGVSLLNKTSQIEFKPLQDARRFGVGLIHDVPPIRKALMQLGLGAR